MYWTDSPVLSNAVSLLEAFTPASQIRQARLCYEMLDANLLSRRFIRDPDYKPHEINGAKS